MTALTDTTQDGYYDVSFSQLSHYYELHYSGPNVPYQSIFSTNDTQSYLSLEQNTTLNTTLKNLELPSNIYGTISLNGFTMNYREIRPPNFDESGTTKYPVLFYCYGGPNSQTVEKRYDIDFHTWLASEPSLEYLIVEVDGRGTGFMGHKFRNSIKGQLGVLESSDQAAAAAYLPFKKMLLTVDCGNRRITLIQRNLQFGDGHSVDICP
jgi:dipeptidyl aminopeptidase B